MQFFQHNTKPSDQHMAGIPPDLQDGLLYGSKSYFESPLGYINCLKLGSSETIILCTSSKKLLIDNFPPIRIITLLDPRGQNLGSPRIAPLPSPSAIGSDPSFFSTLYTGNVVHTIITPGLQCPETRLSAMLYGCCLQPILCITKHHSVPPCQSLLITYTARIQHSTALLIPAQELTMAPSC